MADTSKLFHPFVELTEVTLTHEFPQPRATGARGIYCEVLVPMRTVRGDCYNEGAQGRVHNRKFPEYTVALVNGILLDREQDKDDPPVNYADEVYAECNDGYFLMMDADLDGVANLFWLGTDKQIVAYLAHGRVPTKFKKK